MDTELAFTRHGLLATIAEQGPLPYGNISHEVDKELTELSVLGHIDLVSFPQQNAEGHFDGYEDRWVATPAGIEALRHFRVQIDTILSGKEV